LVLTESAFTALGYAISSGDARTVGEILEGDQFNHQLLKKCDYAGNTAVHLAAVGPQSEILRDLLMRGASVHVRNCANNTPLYLAEKMGNDECVRLLREAGAHLWVAESSAKSSEVEEGTVASNGNAFVEVDKTEVNGLVEDGSPVPNT
jgi:lysophospholipase